ncbi:hypothetical protein OG21DRAFT_1504838 [Imleria badia]|nr:hypothetical protein OG21DRAFT_1504838 [Imleria badia]
MGSYSPDGSFSSNGIPARRTAPKPRQLGYHHASLGTDVSSPHLSLGYQCFLLHQPDYPTFSTTNYVLSSSSGSTKDITSFVHDEGQAPVVIYRPPEKKDSARRHFQSVCAIDIEGLWVDQDDLYTGAGHGSGMISVHECH